MVEQRRALRDQVSRIGNQKGELWLVLHDLAGLGQGPAAELAGDLRALCERWRDHLRVIAIDQSEALFTGTELGSSFLALSHEYRLGWWEAGRVEQHAKDSELRPADADRAGMCQQL